MAVQLLKRLFTVAEYHRMAEAGILGEDDRVELLEGEIVQMRPIGSRHASCVKRLVDIFIPLQVGRKVIISVQDPIRLGEHSEPQPDFTVLKPRPDFYAKAHPEPADVFLVVEVAETSAAYDRDMKVPLYAEAGVPEVWVVDVAEAGIEVYREPAPEGYRVRQVVRRGQHLAPEAFPHLDVAVDDVLG